VSGVVRLWENVRKDGLEHDADPVSAHMAVVRVSVRTLEVKLEAEALDVVGDRGPKIFDDETRTDRGEIPTCFFVVSGL